MFAVVKPPFWHPAFSAGFILDWDGVLAETRLDFAPIRAKYFDGRFVPLFEAVETLPPPLGEQLKKDIYDVEMAGAETAEAVEGARELIDWLETNEIPWCVVSRNCMDSITLAAEKARLKLPPVVRSRDIPPVKPAPEALWSAAEQILVPAKECVMVGDFVYDLVGARRAGMRAVLVQRPEAEWKHWADVSYDRLSQFVVSLKNPEPLVPWEYSFLASEKGRDGLLAGAGRGVVLSSDAPDILPLLLEKADEGVLFFSLDDHGKTLSPVQWKKLPGLSSSWLDQPLKTVVQYLLEIRYPLALLTTEAMEVKDIQWEVSSERTGRGVV
jgi:HAD superfamily hydrolase (TIGR01509 family)